MKTFTVADQPRSPIKYEFACHNGKLMYLSSWGDYGNTKPRKKFSRFCNRPDLIDKYVFTEAFKAMLADESFTNFSEFFKAIEEDELYLELAKELMLKEIIFSSRRIGLMSSALV